MIHKLEGTLNIVEPERERWRVNLTLTADWRLFYIFFAFDDPRVCLLGVSAAIFDPLWNIMDIQINMENGLKRRT
jgi:hypothetical protein